MPRLGRRALPVLSFALLTLPALAAEVFRVSQEHGRYWLVDPEGQRTFSTGVNVFSASTEPQDYSASRPSYAGLRFYEGFEGWSSASLGRLREWGFNTLGSWFDERLRPRQPYVVTLHLGQWFGAPWQDPAASLDRLRELIAREVVPRRDDPWLIGYFLDNELRWLPSSLFSYHATQAGRGRLKRELLRLIKDEYQGSLPALQRDFDVLPTPSSFGTLHGELESFEVRPGRRPKVVERFLEFLADDYYRLLSAEVRKVDARHLLLGDRYANYYEPAVARAAGRYMDVISVNYSSYAQSGFIAPSFLDSLHRLSGKPLLVSEFYATATENRSGNRNSQGPFLVVPTQRERAQAVANMTETLARLPYVVGYHWFQWYDEPGGGRSDDGEDFNMGLVDHENRPYEELIQAFTAANRQAAQRHGSGPLPLGVTRKGPEWQVPAAPGGGSTPGPRLDGRLDEWELPRAWLPGLVSENGEPPFGDVYLVWRPSGLWLGLSYQDWGIGPADPSVVESRKRLTLTVQGDGPPVSLRVIGFDESTGASGLPGPLIVEPLGPTPVAAAQHVNKLLTVVEVEIPAALLGRTRLAAGGLLGLSLRLSMQGEGKTLAWPAEPGRLGQLRLIAPEPGVGAAPVAGVRKDFRCPSSAGSQGGRRLSSRAARRAEIPSPKA